MPLWVSLPQPFLPTPSGVRLLLAFRFYLCNFAHVVSKGAVFRLRSLAKSASFFLGALCVLCREYLGFRDEAVRFDCDHAAAGSTVFAPGDCLTRLKTDESFASTRPCRPESACLVPPRSAQRHPASRRLPLHFRLGAAKAPEGKASSAAQYSKRGPVAGRSARLHPW